MTIADDAYRFCGQFEAEVLLELLLRYFEHPSADDVEFHDSLLETTTFVLQASMEGESLLEELDPSEMNFVAAAWYSERTALVASGKDIPDSERQSRDQWLNAVRTALPSYFCRQGDLL